jgi:ATP-dependent Clp protease ATP-binding subunit ClpX
LVSAVEKVLLKFEKHLPSTDIRKFVVTRAVVENPDQELERLLQDPLNPEMLQRFETLLSQETSAIKKSILDREAELKRRYGMFFREGRINIIVGRMIEKGYDVNTVFEEVVEIQRLVEDFERDFQRRNGIYIRFDEKAIDRITEIALEEDGKGDAICARLAKDYEHGFRLIRDRIGQKEFVLTKESVDDPESYLNRVIRDIYSKQSDQRVEDKEDGH